MPIFKIGQPGRKNDKAINRQSRHYCPFDFNFLFEQFNLPTAMSRAKKLKEIMATKKIAVPKDPAKSVKSTPEKKVQSVAKKAAINAKVVEPPLKDAVPVAKTPAKKVAAPNAKPTTLTKEEKAAAKKEELENHELIYRTTSVIVPIWFGQDSVSKVFKGRQIPSESALCLMLIGASGKGGNSVVGVEINLRPSGFDRQEAHLLAHMGTMSLLGAKMVKWVKKPQTDEEYRLFNVVLTAKGQAVFDVAKRSMLEPYKKKQYLL